MNWICSFGDTLITIGIFELLMLAFNAQITLDGGIGIFIIGFALYIIGFIYEELRTH